MQKVVYHKANEYQCWAIFQVNITEVFYFIKSNRKINVVVVVLTEYRAELYSRLEDRRIKQLVRRNRKANQKETGRQPLKERKVYTRYNHKKNSSTQKAQNNK